MIFILDKSMNVQDTLSNSGEISHITPFFDDIYTSYLETGAETYQFSTLANTKESQHLTVGNHIAFQYENEYKLFTITEIEETHDENFIKTVYCEIASLKLINKIIRPIDFKSTNLRKFLEAMLSDTDWNIGLIDIGLNNVCDIEVKDYTNAYSLLQTHVRESYNGEIHFTVKFEGNKATKYINVYSNRGKFEGFRFSYDSNITSITRTVNFDDLATALIGVGNNGLTFKEIEAEDKPLNQDFITDETSYLLWNDNGSHILGYEKFDTDSPQELLKLTREKLKERCQPKIKYELNPELLGETVKIGDTVYVIDNEFNPPIHLSARINQLSISLTDKSNNSCVLSNFTEITSNITDEMRQIASQLEGYVDGQFPIGGDKIQNGAINGDKLANGQIIQGTHIFANSITADHIQSETIDTEHLKADSIDAEKIQANSITSNHIQSNTIETEHLKANIIQSEHIQSNTIDTNHIIANSINSGHIQTGSITAGSGIIADGAIGNAQISSIDAGKIEAGTIDTSKVTVQGSNGHLRIKGNRLQVFNGTGNQAKERVSVGDVNGDGTVYGLRVRGADGKTVLLDENGVTSEGITDGSITNDKINDDANIDGAKLNINSVVSKINEDGTETIQGTKIEVDGTTLNTKLSTITNKQTEDSERITQAQSQISANTNAIKLKVDEQTYTTDKKDMSSKLEKNTSEISAMKGQIALKVEQTDIENAKSELEGTMDSKIDSAKAEIKITTDAISQNVSNLSQTVSNKADGSTVSSLNSKVSSLETSVNGISGKVTSLEKTTTTLGTQVDTANTNASSALNKANSATTTANNAQNTANTNKSNITDLQGEVSTVKSNVASLEVTTSGISQKVSSVESTTATLSGKVDTANNNATNAQNTANTANATANANKTEISNTKSKVASIETNLNGISSRVSNVETNQTTVNGKVSSLETRMSTAESKITESAITNVVKKNFYTFEETEEAIVSKGYQTASQVQQTVDRLEVKFTQNGGYNLIYNGNFERGLEHWALTNAAQGYIWVKRNENGSPNNPLELYMQGVLDNENRYATQSFDWTSNEPLTLSWYQWTSANGADGSNVYRGTQVTIRYTDGSNSWHTSGNQTELNVWQKRSMTIYPDAGKRVSWMNVDMWCRDTSKVTVYTDIMLEKGVVATNWTPNPNEVYDGVTTIDKDGITVFNTSSSTHTQIDSESFRVENNTGGTVAEFSQNSRIPNLSAGIISANEIYAGNICSKSPKSGDIKFIYVNGSTGNDNNAGTQSSPYKTVQRAIDDIKDKQDQSVTIYVYNSVPGFDLKSVTGTGIITFSLQDSAIINGFVILGGVTNSIRITNETGSLKPTFKNGISIYRCVNVDIYGVTFRGANAQGSNIFIQDTNYCAINSCDLGGLGTSMYNAVETQASKLWFYNCIGSNITYPILMKAFSQVYLPRAGTSKVPDYTGVTIVANGDGGERVYSTAGGTFIKTPSSGWNPTYTPTQKTQTWSFNKIWSDETLHGWSDRQELIQGYSSTWNTGRWTGYMQFTDGMAAIRSAISGGTNLSGRIYVQRTSSSGNSTGSKLCLYASDGTLITNSTSINRSQGVWVSLSSSIIQKIQSGAITYFYLKADSNNTATYFKCESNAKIEITYTK